MADTFPRTPSETPTFSCPHQAQAELRLSMLYALLKVLALAQASHPEEEAVLEVCLSARELLEEVAGLYRLSISEAQRSASHA